jgi:D-sedoheptulose 7-phosphate isomerase
MLSENYFEKFFEVLSKMIVTWRFSKRENPSLNEAVENVIASLLKNHKNGKRVMIIGNGGSAAIAMHVLVDYTNAGLRTADLMNPALLTCLSNDHGYENVFAKPIEIFADKDDILFAISSSGKSQNILKACEAAKFKDCFIVTFSGFSSDNPLRKLGDINFYVPSSHYGFVELAHQTLLHCISDLFVERKNQNKC